MSYNSKTPSLYSCKMASCVGAAEGEALRECCLIFHPFLQYQIYICLLQLKQHGWWWNCSALGKRRKSWDKTPQESMLLMASISPTIHVPPAVQEQMCNQVICRGDAYISTSLYSLPTPGLSNKSNHLSVKEILSSNWNSNLCQTSQG